MTLKRFASYTTEEKIEIMFYVGVNQYGGGKAEEIFKKDGDDWHIIKGKKILPFPAMYRYDRQNLVNLVFTKEKDLIQNNSIIQSFYGMVTHKIEVE